MIRLWRLVKRSRAAEAFTGEGARLYGGRWNHAGTPAVYLAESLALAALETFVHIGAAHRTMRFVAIAVDVPNKLRIDGLDAPLPPNWREEPPPSSTKDLGTAWLDALRAPLLRVPSAIVSVEHNLVLNPRHHDAERLVVHESEPFTFDARMWK